MNGDEIAIDNQGKTLTLILSQRNIQKRLARLAPSSKPVIINGRMERYARMYLTFESIRGLP